MPDTWHPDPQVIKGTTVSLEPVSNQQDAPGEGGGGPEVPTTGQIWPRAY